MRRFPLPVLILFFAHLGWLGACVAKFQSRAWSLASARDMETVHILSELINQVANLLIDSVRILLRLISGPAEVAGVFNPTANF